MKKTLFLLPLIALTSLGISGCKGERKARITYGTLVDSEATELNYGTLQTKIARKENLLISVYQDTGPKCGCWTDFKNVLDEYVREYHTRVYYIGRSEFGDTKENDTFGLSILNDTSDPTFALIKDGKKANEYIYGSDTKPMFTKLADLRNAVTKIARDPQYMLVNESYLDKALFEENREKVVVQYIWNFCSDCNDCFPRVMMPFSEEKVFSTPVWIIDLAIPGILLDDKGDWQGTGLQSYVDFLAKHQLSETGNETFGYDRGFVPTTQVWENGKLVDANTYFNDEVSLVDGEYKITRSFFTEERLHNIHYKADVLYGKTLSAAEVKVSEETINGETTISYSWNQDDAAEYHAQYLKAFLTKYAI